MNFTPSPEQSAIFAHISDPASPNLLVEACPGSGKTTTILHAFSHVPKAPGFVPTSICYLVFNKRNADEAKAKCPKGVNVSTFHSLGLQALKVSGTIATSVKIDGQKTSKLVWKERPKAGDVQNICKLISLLKTLPKAKPEASALEGFADLHNLSFDDEAGAFRVALKVLEKGLADLSSIDFDDMLWLPVVLDVSFPRFDYVFIDECQDTNEIQVEVLKRLAKTRPTEIRSGEGLFFLPSPTHFVAVGDPFQSIYGFRGASSDAISRLKTTFGMTTLPLSVSFRCPQKVVEEAQKVLKIKF